MCIEHENEESGTILSCCLIAKVRASKVMDICQSQHQRNRESDCGKKKNEKSFIDVQKIHFCPGTLPILMVEPNFHHLMG